MKHGVEHRVGEAVQRCSAEIVGGPIEAPAFRGGAYPDHVVPPRSSAAPLKPSSVSHRGRNLSSCSAEIVGGPIEAARRRRRCNNGHRCSAEIVGGPIEAAPTDTVLRESHRCSAEIVGGPIEANTCAALYESTTLVVPPRSSAAPLKRRNSLHEHRVANSVVPPRSSAAPLKLQLRSPGIRRAALFRRDRRRPH